ncbi:MAG: class I SAM-dependent RNA methyltransferase, partial [Anaerolineae bacterium]|nr:class I SAM-dependent RNA methyltransferase [Anaerolineae bacterium]
MSESSFRLQLDRIANGGYALGRHDGQVVFVSYAIPGETVEVRLVEQKQNFVRGVPSAVLEASRERVTPLCPHFGPGLCGGCQWQHITYEAQLRYKQAIVIDQFERVGKFSDPPVRPAIGNPAPWGYRSYATFTIAGDGQSGYYTDDNSAIIPVEVCHILHPALVELYGMLDLGDAQIKRIKYQVGSDESDQMIILETEDDLPPEIETDLPVSINLLLSDNEPVNLLGQSHVTYRVRHRRFRVTAGSFFQVSTVMADVLVDQVMQALSLQGGETILDLYSGVGLFTAFIAEQAGLVVSVESYPPAVTDADENLADLENVD